MAVWPSSQYIDAIERLNKFQNVQTLGYINTDGRKTDNATARTEIATYAGWSNVSQNLGLSGIYFDQTPYQDENDVRAYPRNISTTVRQSDGFGRMPLVVHNPGRVPDKEYITHEADITIVFEGAYAARSSRKELHSRLVPSRGTRGDYAMLVHSVPQSIGRISLRKIVENVRRDVEWLYVTDLTDNVYEGFGSLLETWLGVTW
jgi:hypothetical protein